MAEGLSSAFDQAFARTLGAEGGYVDDPNDPGGATRYGITERTARANGYSGPMRDLPLAKAKDIARTAFWDRYLLDDLEPAVAMQVFDFIYNSGPRPAIEALQRCCGASVDGVLGPKTVLATHKVAVPTLIGRYAARRLLFLADDPKWPDYGRGWTIRVAHNLLDGAS